ncbi:hypothetical protein H6P81_012105 [Aristolochia fimbriata]|uniref:Uncharacterized protein n=1 Tax=Aristolochia fimbriata TaxID=158543 RepID=A0AAV7EEK4_ARIFI|nr:hypothetical protein H6P81_012105 [Aristolochia fimbriata]
MALTVWFYEHMQGSVPAFVYDTTFKLVDREAFPRVLKWGTGNYKHEGTYKSLLGVIGLLQDMSCLEPACNREASYICSSKEESIPDRERTTPSLPSPTIEAPNLLAGETNSTGEKSIPSCILVNPITWCSPPSTEVNENNRSRESDDEVVELKKLRRDVDALKGSYKELLEQLVAKDKENKQLRERVDHLETSVKLLKKPLVDNGVDDHS